MPHFTVAPMEGSQIAAAYPLVRIAAPAVPPADWSDYAERLRAQGGGLVGAFAGEATLHGLATYRIDDTLRGRMLRIDILVTVELSQAAPARAALLEELERLAGALGCDGIALALPARGYVSENTKTDGWRRLGLAFDAVTLAKKVTAAREGGSAGAEGLSACLA